MPNGYSYRSKHTPGPWLQSSTVLVCTAEAKVIANCTPLSEIPQLSIPIMEADANARLIAAAPAMLAALQKVYPILTDKAAREEIGALLNTLDATHDQGSKT